MPYGIVFAIPSILWVSNTGNELLQGATHKEISLIIVWSLNVGVTRVDVWHWNLSGMKQCNKEAWAVICTIAWED